MQATAAETETRLRLQMAGDVLVHLEHRDGLLAIKDCLEGVISVDLRLHFLVLKTVLFDIDPELGNNLRTGKRLGADNRRQFVIRGHGFEEGCVGFTFSGFLGCFSCHGMLLASPTSVEKLFSPLKIIFFRAFFTSEDNVETFSY